MADMNLFIGCAVAYLIYFLLVFFWLHKPMRRYFARIDARLELAQKVSPPPTLL